MSALPRGEVRIMSRPEPGQWLIRLVKGGPLVPARIYWCDHEPGEPTNKLDRWPVPFLIGEVNGRPVEVERIWHSRGLPISEAEFRYRIADAAWVREHAPPGEPIAQPHKPIDHNQTPLLF